MEYKKINCFELLEYGIKTFINNILLFLSIPFIAIGILSVVTMIFAGISFLIKPKLLEIFKIAFVSSPPGSIMLLKQMPIISIIFGALLLLTILYVVFGILYGLIKIVFSIYDGQTPTIFMLAAYFNRTASLLATYAILSSLILLGSAVFLIPGVYIATRLLLAPYILVDKNCGIIEAFKQSLDLTRGRSLTIFSVIVIIISLSLIPVIRIAMFFISKIMYVALYRKLASQ